MTSPAVSWLTVAHHSAAVLPAALASLRREAERAGLAVETVVVDHSESVAEHRRLAALGFDRLIAAPNRGYAAGLNTAFAAARAPVLVAGNPDVEWLTGSLGPLVGALETFDVTGPQFTLGEFLFPPADPQTLVAEWRRLRAGRSPAARRRLLASELRRWRRVWDATLPVDVPALSGALLAFRRSLLQRVGPWDEGYFLFFEETEWLSRARHLGARFAVVPAARVLHRWGHAADARDPAVQERFAASRRRFYGRYGVILDWLSRRPAAPAPPEAAPLPAAGELPREPRLWLASPTPLGLPAAGAMLAGAEVEEALGVLAEHSRALASLSVTRCSAAGEPEARYAWARPAPPSPSGFTVRPVESADWPALDRLFERSFGHAPEPSYWRWKYEQFPGRSRAMVAVCAGEILAHAGALAHAAAVDGARSEIWTLVDFMGTTAGSGLRPPLVDAGRALLADLPGPSDAPWIFGFPSARHFRLGERSFGYRPLFEIATWSGDLPTSRADGSWLRAVDDRGPADCEAIWSRAGIAGVVRSRAFLDWRYWGRPGRYYRMYTFGRAGDEGFAVFAFHQGRAVAAEFWADPGCDRRAVLLEIAADLRSAGLRRWTFWDDPGLLDLGLRDELALSPGEPVFVGIRVRGGGAAADATGRLARSFRYAMGDYDLV